jgi:hypothetical protein
MKILNKLHKMIVFVSTPKIIKAFQWHLVPSLYKLLLIINFSLY